MTRLEDALTQFENAVANLEYSIESVQESAANAKMANSDAGTMSASFQNELSALEEKLDQAVAIIAKVANSGAQQDKVTKVK
ncbi:hypothetical protein [Candidatus Puniceispirillum sp.]|uniref:hypothetical protein n=1 Tax=Candidatus Puniceispirillum sp. TaxID=2026719 RepID=UPI003F6A0631